MLEGWGGAHVRVCFVGAAVERVVPTGASARNNLVDASLDGEQLDVEDGQVLLPANAASPCIEYQSRFERAGFRSTNKDAVILSQKQWLWRPEPFPQGLRASLRFILPEGAEASLPWPEVNGAYSLDESAFGMDAYTVFGRFERDVVSVGGTRLEVVRLGGRPSDSDVRRWLSRAVEAVASVGARFPRRRLHFVVNPVAGVSSPVAFGMVRRGGGASILLLPSEHASVDALERDWVAVHELSHLWFPRVFTEDRWLSEGLATYLQEILRARCGLQTGAQAWRRLREGFARGRRAGGRRELALESKHMHRTAAYQRVYWAGAAFALEADARLRKSSGGQQSLLSAIDAAQLVWGESAGPVSGHELLRVLDQVTGAGFFVALGEQYATASRFPDVSLASAPQHRALRAEITARAPDGCSAIGESPR